MKHASLFSGIGGFDLAAEWMGWETVMQCEIEPFCRKILKYYWPEATLYEDIRTTDFKSWSGRVDILSGGFPCQPFSTAGKQQGKDDDRYLWPEMLRAIREISPRWVVGENVRGLVNWSGGLVFNEVQSDLEAEGYEVLPLLLPASGVGAPHKRERIWFIAFNSECQFKPPGINASDTTNFRHEQSGDTRTGWTGFKDGNFSQPTTNTDGLGLWRKSDGVGKSKLFNKNISSDYWGNFPTQSPVCSGDDGLPAKLDGITLSKHRRESIKAYGNAVVPRLVLQKFKAIETYETHQIHQHPEACL